MRRRPRLGTGLLAALTTLGVIGWCTAPSAQRTRAERASAEGWVEAQQVARALAACQAAVSRQLGGILIVTAPGQAVGMGRVQVQDSLVGVPGHHHVFCQTSFWEVVTLTPRR